MKNQKSISQRHPGPRQSVGAAINTSAVYRNLLVLPTVHRAPGNRSPGRLALILLLLNVVPCFQTAAQPYSIDWYKVAGGGGTSTGGVFSVSATIGQHDSGGPLQGGVFSVTGGFWSIIAVVPAPGVPKLIIQLLGPGSVKVSWPNTGSYTLQQNSNLTTGTWAASGYTITTANGTNSITITPPVGNLFFRLSNP